MINRKEITAIIVMTIVFAFSISLLQSWDYFYYASIAIFVVMVANLLAKKITSFYLESEIEARLWETHRYGFAPHRHLKKGFPIGAVLPPLTSALSFSYFIWMASLVFDVKPKVHRAVKRHGLYSYSEMTEWHIALIAASGILLNLVLSVAGYLAGFTIFAKLSLFYAFFNMIPLSDLDGNKIFLGSIVLYTFLAVLTLIGLGYAFLLI